MADATKVNPATKSDTKEPSFADVYVDLDRSNSRLIEQVNRLNEYILMLKGIKNKPLEKRPIVQTDILHDLSQLQREQEDLIEEFNQSLNKIGAMILN